MSLQRSIISASRRRTSAWVDSNAIRFSGSSQSASKNTPTFGTDNAGALALDITLPSPTGGNVLLSLGKTNTRQWALTLNSSGGNTCFEVTAYVGGALSAICTTTPPTAGTRYRVVFGNDSKIYIDAVEQAVTPRAGASLLSGNKWFDDITGAEAIVFRLAASRSNAAFANVRINNLVYYSSALTPTEATADYNGGVSFDRRSNPALLAKFVDAWYFEGDTLSYSGSNDLALYGTPTYETP